MQSKGLIRFTAICLALACLWQLSFSVVTRIEEKKADKYAEKAVSALLEGAEFKAVAEEDKAFYIDSITKVSNRRPLLVRFYIHVGAELGIDVFHTAKDYLVSSQFFQFSVAHTFQQQDRVLAYFFPQNGIKVTEQLGGFVVPRPPDVACKFRQFLQFGRNA